MTLQHTHTHAQGDTTLLQYLIKKGAGWSDVDQCRKTALHWAVLSQQVRGR